MADSLPLSLQAPELASQRAHMMAFSFCWRSRLAAAWVTDLAKLRQRSENLAQPPSLQLYIEYNLQARFAHGLLNAGPSPLGLGKRWTGHGTCGTLVKALSHSDMLNEDPAPRPQSQGQYKAAAVNQEGTIGPFSEAAVLSGRTDAGVIQTAMSINITEY